MTRFSDTLRALNERLDLPQPVRSRILLEIAGDLEDLEQHFLDSGLSQKRRTGRRSNTVTSQTRSSSN
jgi:hypothetical protein